MNENKTGFPEGEKHDFFRKEIRGSAPGIPSGLPREASGPGDEVPAHVSFAGNHRIVFRNPAAIQIRD
jgi:hypothetical protein